MGADMRSQQFWERVHREYQKHLPKGTQARSQKSVMDKWCQGISHDVSKFASFYARTVRMAPSGTGLQDIMNLALESFKQDQGKPFKFLSCWEILRRAP